MITHYRSQNGRVTPIRAMHDNHLKNAISIIERKGGTVTNHVGLAELKAEHKRRFGD